MRFLRDRAERTAALARELTDAQIDALVFSYEGKARSAEWVLAVLACRHIDEHHRSIKAAIA